MRPNVHPDGSPVPFMNLIHLEKINERTFRSTTEAFQPGVLLVEEVTGGRPRTYGGHVYAQAVWAASQTVGVGFVVHSVTGFFTLLGASKIPFVYTVRQVRDGKSYCVRTVEVTQEETKGICFTSTCSFKQPEEGSIECQKRLDLGNEYAAVLEGKTPEDHPDQLSLMQHWFMSLHPDVRARAPPLPGLRTKYVDMEAYNQHRSPLDRRQLSYYSAIGPMQAVTSNPNLHACAHLYASDRNSLFVISRHLDLNQHVTLMASLSHTVVFHVGVETLSMVGKDGKEHWFCQEAWTDRAGDGRGVHNSRIWDGEGRHIATTLQDGLLRLRFEDTGELERARARLEGGRTKL